MKNIRVTTPLYFLDLADQEIKIMSMKDFLVAYFDNADQEINYFKILAEDNTPDKRKHFKDLIKQTNLILMGFSRREVIVKALRLMGSVDTSRTRKELIICAIAKYVKTFR